MLTLDRTHNKWNFNQFDFIQSDLCLQNQSNYCPTEFGNGLMHSTLHFVNNCRCESESDVNVFE